MTTFYLKYEQKDPHRVEPTFETILRQLKAKSRGTAIMEAQMLKDALIAAEGRAWAVRMQESRETAGTYLQDGPANFELFESIPFDLRKVSKAA